MGSQVEIKAPLKEVSNKKLEAMLNIHGPQITAQKLGVSTQGLYKSLSKRGGRSRLVYFLNQEI